MKTRKIISVLIACVLSLSLCVPAFAAVPDFAVSVSPEKITVHSEEEIVDNSLLFARALNGVSDVPLNVQVSMPLSINGTQISAHALTTTQYLNKEIDTKGNEMSSYVTTFICDLVEEELPDGSLQLSVTDASYTKQSNTEFEQSSDVRLFTKVYWDEGSNDGIPYVVMTQAEAWYVKLDPTCNASNLQVQGRYQGIEQFENGTTGRFINYSTGWRSGGSVSITTEQRLEASEAVYWWMYADGKITMSRGNQTWNVEWTTVASSV